MSQPTFCLLLYNCLLPLHSLILAEKYWCISKNVNPTLLLSTSSCAQCTVRPSKPKHQRLEQRKVYHRAVQKQVARVQITQTPLRVSAKYLKAGWGQGSGIKIAGRNINSLRYADDTALMAESEEELKKPLDESEKVGLKLNIQKTKIMASSPITSWQIGNGNSERLYLGSIPKSLQMLTAAMVLI